MDPTELLVNNLLDAFRQLNQLLALALAASVSALALEAGAGRAVESEPVTVSGFVPMSREHAQLVLLGVCLVAGWLASFIAAGAADIVDRLGEKSADVLAAACSYPSVATAPVGYPILASSLPVALIAPVFWRMWRKINERGILVMFALIAIAFLAVGFEIVSMQCRSS